MFVCMYALCCIKSVHVCMYVCMYALCCKTSVHMCADPRDLVYIHKIYTYINTIHDADNEAIEGKYINTYIHTYWYAFMNTHMLQIMRQLRVFEM